MKAANGLTEGKLGRHAVRSFPPLPDGLCCPDCGGAIAAEAGNARCAKCGRSVVVHGGRIPDFLSHHSSVADTILRWPDEFIRQAEPSLLAFASGRPISSEASALMEANRLLEREHSEGSLEATSKQWSLDPGTRLTSLGSNLAYHCAEFAHQATPDGAGRCLERFVRLSSLGPEATVLDVGCGAGQTLRLLDPYRPAERIGFDIDLDALAFGCRLAERKGEAVRFLRASAHHIPFRANRFTHVLCRVALNYVHQRRALCEMVRVLRPDGYLYCAVEGPGFDVQFLKQARTAAQVVCRLRDLVYGVTLALAGVQATPGRRLTGGRAFGTVRRCTQVLARCGCEVIQAEVTSRSLGMPIAFEVIARKRSPGEPAATASL